MTEERFKKAGTRVLGLLICIVFISLGFWEMYMFDPPRFMYIIPVFVLDWMIAGTGFTVFIEVGRKRI